MVQNTPYVGHPAYKAMGARAGYTLATGLVIGLGAMGGAIAILVGLVPEAAVAPILIFVGPRDHRPGLPRHAGTPRPRGGARVRADDRGPRDDPVERHPRQPGARPGRAIRGEAADAVLALRLLGNGFILTALLWAAAAAMIIDRRLLAAAAFLSGASLGSLCGLIHSPLGSGGLFWPGGSGSPWPGLLAGGYGLLAGMLVLLAPVAVAASASGDRARGEPDVDA